MLALYVSISRMYYAKPTDKTATVLYEQDYYVIKNKGGNDSLVVVPANDSVLFVTVPNDTAFMKSITIERHGAWINKHWIYSCHGRIAVKDDGYVMNITDTIDNQQLTPSNLKDFVSKQRKDINNKLTIFEKQQQDIDYYFNSHQLQDEGFDIVIRRKEQVDHAVDSLRRIANVINRVDSAGNLEISASHRYVANGRLCHKIRSFREGYLMYQVNTHHTPSGVRPVYIDELDDLMPGSVKAVSLTIPIDTLYIGKRDSLGRYTGQGILATRTGYYYEGSFVAGEPDGFGVAFDHRVRAGSWKDGRYRGEQPTYSANHVYGIDVSRYQHEDKSGKVHWAVDWKNMRITSLGHISKKKVAGEVNFPVSFVFIKATESINIKNKYYLSDYSNARANGLRVGSYHFFSMKVAAEKQADYFLAYCKYQKGDMPPVLDVEPTPQQIASYGGGDTLLWAIRVWLEKVEKKLGVKPILYVDHKFFNKYLSDESTNRLTQKYDVWIARYGEYKPIGHLRFWQLSPDGHVSGIHPAVDINIFNGNMEAFRKYNR